MSDAPPVEVDVDDVILYQGKAVGRAVLFEGAKQYGWTWGQFSQETVDEDSIVGIMSGAIRPETFQPVPMLEIKQAPTPTRPPSAAGATMTAAPGVEIPPDWSPPPPLPESTEAQGGPSGIPTVPTVPTVPVPAPPGNPYTENQPGAVQTQAPMAFPAPSVDHKKLLSIMNAAAKLAEASADTAKELLGSHDLERGFRVLHPKEAEVLYGEDADEAPPGLGSVVLAIECTPIFLSIVTNNGPIRFRGSGIHMIAEEPQQQQQEDEKDEDRTDT